jgi:hypothetical protein
MKQTLIIALVLLAVLGGWLLLSSTSRTGAGLSERDSVYAHQMKQLRKVFDDSPFQPAFTNHLYMELDDGSLMFFHFNAPLGQDSRLLYIGIAVPGRFCKQDQERVESQYGPGFPHFHQKVVPGATDAGAGHGGQGGEEGYWFRHVAVGEFDMPWGHVTPGIDHNFMPTPAPEC